MIRMCLWFNSLTPNDAIWRHKSGSTLAQVMACCLTAASHYLSQCWLIIKGVPWLSPESNFTRSAHGLIVAFLIRRKLRLPVIAPSLAVKSQNFLNTPCARYYSDQHWSLIRTGVRAKRHDHRIKLALRKRAQVWTVQSRMRKRHPSISPESIQDMDI